MSGTVQNLLGTRRLRVLLPFVPALVLPLALAGVAVPATGGSGALLEAIRVAEEAATRARKARQTIVELGEPGELALVTSAIERLRGVIPPPVSEVDIFNRLRLVGQLLGLNLSTSEIGEVRALDMVVEGETVHIRELVLGGRASLSRVVALVDELRREGLPTAVLDVALSRGSVDQKEFQFNLRIGLFHRAAAPAASVTPSNTEQLPAAE